MDYFLQKSNRLIWTRGHEMLQIEPWGPDSLRVRATRSAQIQDPLKGIGALVEQEPITAEIEIGEDQALIRNGAICAEISESGEVRFLRTEDGEELLAEEPRHFVWPPARHFEPLQGDYYRIETNFRAYAGERIYGLGQQQHGSLDQKGHIIDLIQRNTEITIPFLLSNRGYGFLWHSPAVGRVELGYNATRWVADAALQLDYWITSGDTPTDILDRYTLATGRSPVLPEWAAGFWQCKLRYCTQDELLDVACEHKSRGLPLSIIVIDGGHWTMMGDWQLDSRFWPDPIEMVNALEVMGVKLLVSVWPTVNTLSRNFETMKDRGLLVSTRRGNAAVTPMFDVFPPGMLNHYLIDATHPEARAFLWEKIKEGYYQYGIKLFWLDADEPEIYPIQPDNLQYHLGPGQAVHNIYPLLHARCFYDGLISEGETEVLSLNRSAWAGSQRYGAAVWSGDIDSTFEALRVQVRAGLNIGMSGIPWWTTDIGGFKGGHIEDPYFQELIVRWFQYGVFCPIFRLHGLREPAGMKVDIDKLTDLAQEAASDEEDGERGAFSIEKLTGAPNEVWSFGEETYEIIRELLFLRERLKPYIMDQMRTANHHGTPPMRPLFFEFPADDAAYAVEDQYLFGPSLLVAPVLYSGARQREVYLPRGADWMDVWTGDIYAGGQSITISAPLDRIPLFTRDGVSLPITSPDKRTEA
jgi:alpha-D-xyloside xylohydrolase